MQTESLAREQTSISSWVDRIPGYLLQIVGLWVFITSLIVGIQSALKIWNYTPQDGSVWVFALFNYTPVLICIVFTRIGFGLFMWGRRSYSASVPAPINDRRRSTVGTLDRHPVAAIFLRFAGWAIMNTPKLLVVLPIAFGLVLFLIAKGSGFSNIEIAIKIFVLWLPAMFLYPLVERLGSNFEPLGAEMLITGKKLGAARASEVLEEDRRPPVLYLRSFKDDETFVRRSSFRAITKGIKEYLSPSAKSEEQQIARVLDDIGPFVAIGQPGERLPDLGAARMYVGDEWQQVIEDLVARARLIVMRAGITRGFWWEFDYVVKNAPPEKILLLIPFQLMGYAGFREQANRYLPKPLADYVPLKSKKNDKKLTGLVYFERDWTSHFLKMETGKYSLFTSLPLELKWNMEPVFKQLGVPYRKPQTFTTVSWVITILKWTMIFWLCGAFRLLTGAIPANYGDILKYWLAMIFN